MKKLTGWIVVIMFALAVSVAHANSEIDIKAGGLYYVPSDNDIWDNGYGVEGQIQFWPMDMLGFSFSIGGAKWDLNGESESYAADGYFVSGKSDGYATLIPVGGSFLIRPVNIKSLTLTLEAGVRYVVVDPNADYDITVSTPDRTAIGSVSGAGGTRVFSYRVPGETIEQHADYEADDAVVGIAEADLEFRLSDRISLFTGCGWQFDIEKSEASVTMFGEKIKDDVSMEAFFVKAGAIIKF